MSAGTISLTNNSANVTGAGTAFTTDLKANDFIVVIVGGVTYTLGVKATASATALTLITPYNGPTATGNAWTAVPNATLVGITAQVAADVAKAIRGLNLDKANWQQVYSGTGTITVTLPDGSTYTGPAWNSITNSLAAKAGKGANGDITSLTGLTTALSIAQGGTGATSRAAAQDALGLGINNTISVASIELYNTVPFIDFHYGNSSADYTARLIQGDAFALTCNGVMLDAAANFRSRRGVSGATLTGNGWNFYWNDGLEMWVQTSNIGKVQTVSSSDALLKNIKERATDKQGALAEVLQWLPTTFSYKARGVLAESDDKLGFIANELVEASPECVEGEGLKEGWDELNPVGAYTLNEVAMIAKLTLALQAQQELIEELQDKIATLTAPQEPTS